MLTKTLCMKVVTLVITFFFIEQFKVNAQTPTLRIQIDPREQNYGEIILRLNTQGTDICKTAGLDFKNILKVYALAEVPSDKNFPQVSGKYSLLNRQLIFRPKYPPPPGIEYTIVLDSKVMKEACKELFGASFALTTRFLEVNSTANPVVEKIYPSSNVVPSNLLRFYIHFSQPMSIKNPYEFLILFDDAGNEVQDPFVEIPEGLWNNTRKRLTVFIHPGRVKRGIGPNATLGPVLKAGLNYTLTMAKDWPDINGNTLGIETTRRFKVSAPTRDRIDPTKWTTIIPEANSLDTLTIVFDNRVIDSALAHRLINIEGPSKKRIEGEILFGDNEMSWLFIPNQPWIKGNYAVSINTKLEDVSGNNVKAAFDISGTSKSKHSSHKLIEIGIEIK